MLPYSEAWGTEFCREFHFLCLCSLLAEPFTRIIFIVGQFQPVAPECYSVAVVKIS